MAGIPQRKRSVGRRFVVACDGTWQNSDGGVEKPLFGTATAQVSSNVPRIVRAIKPFDGSVNQIVYYQRGVASADNSFQTKVVGGITGEAITGHIREAYGFLANNFNPQNQADLKDQSKAIDEIILLGFSRGAFTARAISSLISDVGLLTKRGMENFWGIFEDWKNQNIDGKHSKWFEATFGQKIEFTDERYRNKLIEAGMTRWGMSIRAVGVWDTVGALGIPISFQENNVKEFSFVNTKVSQLVEYAFHAVALDESRNLFTPTLWEQPDQPNNLKRLKQCWFPGVHSNVGGSYLDAGIANITLAWMISQLEDNEGGLVAFDPDYLDFVQDLNNKWYATAKEPIRPWGMGRLYDSTPDDTINGLVQSISPIIRTPGRYYEVSTNDGQKTKQRLRNTGECIHRCVRVRINAGGRDIEGNADTSTVSRLLDSVKKTTGRAQSKTYICEALANYDLVQPPNVVTETDHSGSGGSGVVWKAKDGLESLPEDELGQTEIRLLRRSVETGTA